MYTHCRQFPHFKGIEDLEIYSRVSRSLSSRPCLRSIIRVRNLLLVVTITFGIYFANFGITTRIGGTLMIIGGTGFCVIFVWNLVWVNCVLFPITLEDYTGNR